MMIMMTAAAAPRGAQRSGAGSATDDCSLVVKFVENHEISLLPSRPLLENTPKKYNKKSQTPPAMMTGQLPSPKLLSPRSKGVS